MPRPRWIDPVAMQIRRVGATGEEEVASGECGVMSQDGEEKADSFRQGRGRRDDSGGGALRPRRGRQKQDGEINSPLQRLGKGAGSPSGRHKFRRALLNWEGGPYLAFALRGEYTQISL